MLPHYDTNKPYDGGLRYADDPGAVLNGKHHKPMSKPKLDLGSKTDVELVDFATAHKTAMTGNANFPSPMPTAEVFDDALDAGIAALADINTKLAAARMAVADKDTALDALRTLLVQRAAYVETASEGDESKILSAGFDVRLPRTPSQPLPAPVGVLARMGEAEGTIRITWTPVPGSDSYVIECSPNVLPRIFAQVKVATRSNCTATDLTSGQRYVFRVAAVGPLGQGPWSDETTRMAL